MKLFVVHSHLFTRADPQKFIQNNIFSSSDGIGLKVLKPFENILDFIFPLIKWKLINNVLNH